MIKSGRLVFTLAMLAASFGAHAESQQAAAFEELKQLVGEWRPSDSPDSSLRVEFALIARDSVLVETWRAPNHASMTVFHMDGDRMLATHYCPRGNQPRMALVGRTADDALRFEFVDGTGLDEPGERYEHLLTMRIDEAGELIRGEIYLGLGEEQPVELGAPEESRFMRVADEAADFVTTGSMPDRQRRAVAGKEAVTSE